MYYDRTDLSKGIDVVKSSKSKEYTICHYWFFNHGFEFQNSVSNVCHDLTMLCLNLRNISIITLEGVNYRGIIYQISKSEAVHLLENSVLEGCGIYKQMHIKETNIKNRVYNYYVDNLIKAKKNNRR